MKKVLLGAAVGAGLAYVVSKLHKQGKLDSFYDDVNKFANKAKRNFNIATDLGKNQVEYIKDRVDYKVNKGDNE